MPIPIYLRLRVLEIVTEADDVRSFVLVPESGDALPRWRPGAHVDVRISDSLVRQYSLCGDTDHTGRWRFAVLREPAGRGGSAYLHDQVGVGDVLEVSAPRNNFPLVDAPRYVFLAGGIGITPLLPMLAEVDRAGRDWRLWYGGRTRRRMAFRTALTSRYGDRVILHPEDEYGPLPLRAILCGPAEGERVYCCGPEGLLNAVEQACAARPAGVLHVERFRPRAVEAPVGGSFEVVLRSSGRVVTVTAEQSVLDALALAGLSPVSSCREGTCASCETAVLEGEVDHRDSVLSPAERAAGGSMMICVSRARSPRLVLDL